jgi:hypothetical protein
MNWVGKVARTNIETTQRLMRCRTLHDVAEAQGAFLTGTMRNWMERNAQVLEASQQTAKQAIESLEAPLG